jgi:hypothetical protein
MVAAGQRHLLTPFGDTDWSRNLRAAGGGRLRRGRRVEDFTAVEVPPQQRGPLIESERLYDDINAAEGRSNLDIEKHLRRAEVKPPRPRSGWRWPASWEARANGTVTQGRQ